MTLIKNHIWSLIWNYFEILTAIWNMDCMIKHGLLIKKTQIVDPLVKNDALGLRIVLPN